MHEACFVTSRPIAYIACMIFLALVSAALTGLVGEMASPIFCFLPLLAQLESTLLVILEGVPPS